MTFKMNAAISPINIFSSWDCPVPEAETFTIHDDVLVLSCTIKRLRDLNRSDPTNHQINTMLKPVDLLILSEDSKYISTMIIDADIELAAKIRDYYGQKLTLVMLRDGKLSEYREKLAAFLSDFKTTFTESQLGLVYKLPYFYSYDLVLSVVFDGDYRQITDGKRDSGIKKLTYIRALEPSKKYRGVIEYWFRDDDDNRVLLEIDKNNPLIPLFEIQAITSPIDVKATFIRRARDQMEYYLASSNWKLNLK